MEVYKKTNKLGLFGTICENSMFYLQHDCIFGYLLVVVRLSETCSLPIAKDA
jgi:hypothetical protein